MKIDTVKEIRGRKHEIDEKIVELRKLSDLYAGVIEDMEGTGVHMPPSTNNGNHSINDDAPGLTDFVRGLFNQYPAKKWTTKGLRAEARSGIDSGKVAFFGKNLGASLQTVISRLSRKREIEKGGRSSKRWYRHRELDFLEFDNL